MLLVHVLEPLFSLSSCSSSPGRCISPPHSFNELSDVGMHSQIRKGTEYFTERVSVLGMVTFPAQVLASKRRSESCPMQLLSETSSQYQSRMT